MGQRYCRDGLAEACQRSLSSTTMVPADGTTGLAGRKVHALVQGEAASSTKRTGPFRR